MASYKTNNRPLDFVVGAVTGALCGFLLDPRSGRRRRARLLSRSRGLVHSASNKLAALGHSLGNHAQGLLAETRGRWTETEVSDLVLEQRVRARLGRIVDHPREVRVKAAGGTIIVTGRFPEKDIGGLLACIRGVRGVKAVQNRVNIELETAPGLSPGAASVL